MNIKKHVLVVTLVNTYEKEMALRYHNADFPYRFRTIEIPLTDEQNRMIARRPLGVIEYGSEEMYEELYNAHLEIKEE